ncbi:MAG TPA: hypothetical protein VGF08_05740 [Terriglobales bacterium]
MRVTLELSPTVSGPSKQSPQPPDLGSYYEALFRAWGPQNWWPARTPFEVIVGAYLTQNTSWTNVEQALQRMRSAGVLSLAGVRRTRTSGLERLIRPAGYFRQKARRLKGFVAFLDRRYDGSLRRMFAQPTQKLREELLSLQGIGPETADSILLYAGNHPVFVVDAYTRRIFARHGMLSEDVSYDTIRSLFEESLGASVGVETRAGGTSPSLPWTAHPPSVMSETPRSPLVQIYNEMHGLIVAVGKQYCRKQEARCEKCPLREFLPGQGVPGPAAVRSAAASAGATRYD